MKTKALLFSVLVFILNCTTSLAQNASTASGDTESLADELPEYPGGVMEMMNFVKTNLKYPQKALDAKISGKCQLKFTVNPDGSLSDITVLDGMPNCPECETEAIRIVKSMPKWKAGRIAGKAVALYYNLPVSFSLPKK
jgi:protein TonB